MGRAKIGYEKKVEIVRRYLSGETGYTQILLIFSSPDEVNKSQIITTEQGNPDHFPILGGRDCVFSSICIFLCQICLLN